MRLCLPNSCIERVETQVPTKYLPNKAWELDTLDTLDTLPTNTVTEPIFAAKCSDQ
jgi:hypothetical protein